MSHAANGGTLSAIPADVAEQHSVRGVFFISGNRSQLDQITGLVDTGKLKVLSEVLPLARAREAFEHGAADRAPGKIVLQVAA